MKQGKFIVFEGLDGSGKTTQLERLGARLTEKLGTNAVYCTREPGDSAPGILCQQFSQKKLALAPETVALLYAADRVEHIAKDLLPRLEAGQTVLCDRYYFSNFAYQTLTSDLEDLLRYNAFARRTLRPDAVVFVDVDPEECARRRAHRGGAAEFYEKTEQPNKISDLLQDCEDKNVLSAMNDYVSSAPEFSLKEGTYDEVQQVTLTSATGGTIYYTTDGSDPTESSTEYKEAVLLQSEGDTEIRAIAVNKKGIPSAVSSAKYSIEFPLVDAPAVSPSTGQYSTATQITITVPDGYTAYYTMDGSTPTASSEKYTDPIDMPENSQTTFSAILVNDKNGKATEVTTRNYITTY